MQVCPDGGIFRRPPAEFPPIVFLSKIRRQYLVKSAAFAQMVLVNYQELDLCAAHQWAVKAELFERIAENPKTQRVENVGLTIKLTFLLITFERTKQI